MHRFGEIRVERAAPQAGVRGGGFGDRTFGADPAAVDALDLVGGGARGAVLRGGAGEGRRHAVHDEGVAALAAWPGLLARVHEARGAEVVFVHAVGGDRDGDLLAVALAFLCEGFVWGLHDLFARCNVFGNKDLNFFTHAIKADAAIYRRWLGRFNGNTMLCVNGVFGNAIWSCACQRGLRRACVSGWWDMFTVC